MYHSSASEARYTNALGQGLARSLLASTTRKVPTAVPTAGTTAAAVWEVRSPPPSAQGPTRFRKN